MLLWFYHYIFFQSQPLKKEITPTDQQTLNASLLDLPIIEADRILNKAYTILETNLIDEFKKIRFPSSLFAHQPPFVTVYIYSSLRSHLYLLISR